VDLRTALSPSTCVCSSRSVCATESRRPLLPCTSPLCCISTHMYTSMRTYAHVGGHTCSGMNVRGEVCEGETCEEASAGEGPQESSALVLVSGHSSEGGRRHEQWPLQESSAPQESSARQGPLLRLMHKSLEGPLLRLMPLGPLSNSSVSCRPLMLS